MKLENIKKISKLHRIIALALSPTPEMKILPALAKISLKKKLSFSRSALFHMKTTVRLKYFVNDCSLSNNCGNVPY